jgi:hypothetical protein
MSAALHAGQCRAQAVVRAVPEGQVRADVAVDVEMVRVLEAALVAVGGGGHEEHRGTGGDLRAVVLDVLGHIARDVRLGGS